jgi:thiol-disulfide isomerase/thioredoxin
MSRLVTALAVLLCVPAARAGLKVGDEAPALKVAKWVKGKPITLSEGKDKQIYVIEFWATWCPPCRQSIPHLTKIAQHFEKSNVTIIGVSIDSEKTKAKVEPFVTDMGKKMEYTVAWDGDDGAANKAYMEAAGARGIPHAFIVGKDGKIAWQGHPMDGMDLKIAELVGDTAYAEEAKKVKELRDKLQSDMSGEDFDKGLAHLDELIKVEPSESQWSILKYRVLIMKKDPKAAEKWGQELVAKVEDAEALNELSWRIMTEDEFADSKDLKLALAMGKKANELTGGKNWEILDTYARALFENKNAKEAVETEKKAIALAEKADVEDEARKALKDALDLYEHPEKKREEKGAGDDEK